MADVELTFDDVLEPPKRITIRGVDYVLPSDLPSDVAILQMKAEVESLRSQRELEELDKQNRDRSTPAPGALEKATAIAQRMTDLTDDLEGRVLELFTRDDGQEVDELPITVPEFFQKLVPYLYREVSLDDLVGRGAEAEATDPTSAGPNGTTTSKPRAKRKAPGSRSRSSRSSPN